MKGQRALVVDMKKGVKVKDVSESQITFRHSNWLTAGRNKGQKNDSQMTSKFKTDRKEI